MDVAKGLGFLQIAVKLLLKRKTKSLDLLFNIIRDNFILYHTIRSFMSDTKNDPIYQMLLERGKTHGSFEIQADISQQFKDVYKKYTVNLNSQQREAIEMILHKIARILAGNPDHLDHWLDISGYAALIHKN